MIRSGPILASLVAAGLVLPTLGSFLASPHITRGPYLQWAPPGAATVVWYTEAAGDGVVEFRGEGGPWVEAHQQGVPGKRHQVLISGLLEGETYEYHVVGPSGPLPDLNSRQEFAFRAPSSSSLRFLAFGDSGSGDANQLALAQLMARESPDLALLLGDIVYPTGLDADYDAKFFAPYASLLSRAPFYALLGNHDYETQQGAPYLEIFSLPRNGPPELRPETVYSFEQGGVHFSVHDSNLSPSQLRQYAGPWQVADLRQTSARFRIAALHHTPYSSGANSVLPPTAAVREFFGPLFAATGVDLVLAGHEHVYERTRPLAGVVYVTSGAGGMPLYPRVASNDYTEVFYGQGGRHSYTRVEVAGTHLWLTQTDLAGCLVDTLILDKVVAEGDTLRIFKGITGPPQGWTQPGFVDRGWPQATTAFGYDSVDLSTPLTDMKGAYLSVYARASFVLSSSSYIDEAYLKLRYDDGFVAYLNGVEVARRNLPEGQGPGTPAGAAHSGEWFEAIGLPASLLRTGVNVLALEGHNRSLNDSSFILAPELLLLTAEKGSCS